jgi:hypothetical protein
VKTTVPDIALAAALAAAAGAVWLPVRAALSSALG